MINKTSKSLFTSIIHKNLSFFNSKPKSFYEILDVKPTSTQKELRSQFLKKGKC